MKAYALFSVSVESHTYFYCFCHRNMIFAVLYLFFLPQPIYLGKHLLTFTYCFLSSRHQLKEHRSSNCVQSDGMCSCRVEDFGVPSSQQDQPALIILYDGSKKII